MKNNGLGIFLYEWGYDRTNDLLNALAFELFAEKNPADMMTPAKLRSMMDVQP